MIRNDLFWSESVSEGHPDKLADRISDRILDAFLERDPKARVACETVLADQFVLVAGEFKTKTQNIFDEMRARAEGLVRSVLRETGYTLLLGNSDRQRPDSRGSGQFDPFTELLCGSRNCCEFTELLRVHGIVIHLQGRLP
jgi:S-adenosylmethionine synthetase